MIKYSLIISLFFYSCTTTISYNKVISNNNHFIKIDKIENVNTYINQNNILIFRDNWGVPHIYAKTDADAAFGLAYAHSEDDFSTIHDALLHTRGKYASVYGTGKNNINSAMDYLVGLLKIWDVVENEYDSKLSDATKRLCESYAKGINQYIEENNSTIKQFIYPVSAKDVVAGFIYKIPFFFDVPIFISGLYNQKPKDIPKSYKIKDKLEMIKSIVTTGSNVFAVAPSKSQDKSTLLAVNSHQPWEGDLAWYEAHIHSEEGWNMTGGLFPGSPIVLVGHNENLGWGHTVNSPDILDIYVLEINPKNKNQYLLDDKWLEFEEFEIPIDIKISNNSIFKHKEKAFWSIHGPVIKGKYATYAIRYSWENNIKTIEQWYNMNKANSFESWKAAISDISIPMFNTGYADKEGNIFYIYNAKLPIRHAKYNWEKYVPGNTSSTLWKDFYSFEDLPQIINPKSGYIQNCNNSPYQTTSGKNPTPPKSNSFDNTYIGIENFMTNRSLRALELFSKDSMISYEEFKNYKFDLNYSKKSNMATFVSRGKKMLQNHRNIRLSNAYDILNDWDFSTNVDNPNTALAILSFGAFVDSKSESISNNSLLVSIKEAVRYLYNNYGRLDVLWGKINRLIRGNTNLPLSGGPDISRAIYGIPMKDGYLKSIAGDAYMMLIKWDEEGNVLSESIHQYGAASTVINSNHYSDQAILFSREQLKPVLLHLDDLLKNYNNVSIFKK